MIGTSEFLICTRRILAILFIASIFAIVLVVALPRFENASTVRAAEFVRGTRMESFWGDN